MASSNQSRQEDPTSDPSEEPISSQPQATGPPYSVFSSGQKRAIILTASLGAFFSPMSAQIYLPALNSIAKDIGVSSSKINFSITTYMIMQGIAPTIVAGFADGAGRRPAYMIGFTIYILANIGLAVQDNYIALMILRPLQSAGSSGMVALSNGCVGDIVTSSERGLYIAYASLSSVLGPSLAPILGGSLSQYLGWRSVFWFLTIFAVVYFVPQLLFFPETCRKVVGDGSVPPPKWQQSITDRRRFARREKAGLSPDPEQLDYVKENYRLGFPNPFATLKMISDKEAGCILFSTGLVLMCFFAIAAGVPSQYKRLYGFTDLELGFVFLPMACGTLCSAFATGKIVDWNYRRHARRLGFPVQRNRQMDLTNFPIEKARLQVALPASYIAASAVIIYGWALQYHAPVAIPLILMFFFGFSMNAGNQCMNILMVDTWPGRPATATAASNLVRCSLGATSAAVVLPMLDKIGIGWTYTCFALVWLSFSPLVIALMKWGPGWRKERKEREEKAKVRKKSARDVKEVAESMEEAKPETIILANGPVPLPAVVVNEVPDRDEIGQHWEPVSARASSHIEVLEGRKRLDSVADDIRELEKAFFK